MKNEMHSLNKQPVQNRLEWADIIRSIAIICVVLTHSIELVYPLNPDGFFQRSLFENAVIYALFTIGRIGVPLFFLLSGFLLLDRTYDKEAIHKFYKRNFIPLLIVTELWIIIYHIFRIVFYNEPWDFVSLIAQMLFLVSIPMPHMWYMPVILGIYLFLPWLANAIKQLSWLQFILPLSIAAVYLWGGPFIIAGFHAIGLASGGTQLDLSLSGGVYGAYLLLGYGLKKGHEFLHKKWIFFTVGALSFLLAVGMQLISYLRGGAYNIWYNNLLLVIIGFCVFRMFYGIQIPSMKKGFFVLSKYSFAIFLLHMPVLSILSRYISFERTSIQVIFLLVAALIISFGIAVLINTNKKIGQVLMLVK